MATKPQSNPTKRPQKKIKILNVKKAEPASLLAEYFYPILGFLLVFLTGLFAASGYGFDEAVVIALWVVGILFVARMAWRLMRGETDVPKKGKKAEKPRGLMASVPKNYKPPDVPRLSKDFSPNPPAGDKRYPPPSPFIKPPK
ncbi:MAG TPA: hypothetical protein VE077_13865 [Candidatus Methylomirabilis sp.]|nr:hypothetical protein [Candidatus Methylomirabilis sp.]